MKLELKHLAPYLPYGLKMISTCDLHEDYEDIADDYSELLNKGNVFELYLITTESIDFYDGDCDDFAVKSERIRLSNAGCFKPILRPLSDLTKEIEVNGEKFVPIVEIGKILGFGFLERFEEEDGVIEYGWNSHGMEDTQPYAFGYFEDGKFGVWYDCIDDNYPIDEHCSISSTNKLFEWHFDVFGLIESGLAIDINTLES